MDLAADRATATVITFFLGIAAARWMARFSGG